MVFSTGRQATGTTRSLAVTCTYQVKCCAGFTFASRFAIQQKMKIFLRFCSPLSEKLAITIYCVMLKTGFGTLSDWCSPWKVKVV